MSSQKTLLFLHSSYGLMRQIVTWQSGGILANHICCSLTEVASHISPTVLGLCCSWTNKAFSGYTIDGSYTMWFGPEVPKGHEGNWIQTMSGKSFNVLLRLYGPMQTWFDKTWNPGDFELVMK